MANGNFQRITQQRTTQHADGMSLRYDSDFALFATFSSVALLAEHLAIFFGGSASIAPWSDMVALHKFEAEILATKSAFMLLLFPYGKFYLVGERTEVKVMFVAY